MSDPLQPGPPPTIDRRRMWSALLLPSGVVTVGNAVVAANSPGPYGENFLNILPIGLLAVIFGTILFSGAIRPRYRGRSRVMLNCFYFLGQVVIGIGVWAGSCLGFMELR
ncbi:hypothetical protein [Luteolibacter sp. LG18]|uniref:hypothetical protein n=1 Tax=Luteolibacter sp. LG18 TaxID=2819286 RepID=UPI0030C74166